MTVWNKLVKSQAIILFVGSFYLLAKNDLKQLKNSKLSYLQGITLLCKIQGCFLFSNCYTRLLYDNVCHANYDDASFIETTNICFQFVRQMWPFWY